MRKIFVIAALFSSASSSFAQEVTPCTEIFISEYVEGSRNNKALELYNPTESEIDLSQYRTTRWQNGSATWASQYSDVLSGKVGPRETFVVVIDRTDPNGTGYDTPVVEDLRYKADLFVSKDYNVSYSMSFNGDDALSVDKYYEDYETWVAVDIFGKIGERPPFGGWSDSFPYNEGNGTWYTSNHTLVRKPEVITGIDTIMPIRRGVQETAPQAVNPQYFDPSAEWELYPRDFFDSLGSHVCRCATLSNEKQSKSTANVFPVPAKDRILIDANTAISNVRVFGVNGQELTNQVRIVSPVAQENPMHRMLEMARLNCGVYFLHIELVNGNVITRQITK
ncbi:MAG: lamin tail domain-containing protein [Bacteroidota bacterium]|nr:lamin tail domain-containing protein [Bacteroidota bacterium]